MMTAVRAGIMIRFHGENTQSDVIRFGSLEASFRIRGREKPIRAFKTVQVGDIQLEEGLCVKS